MSSHQDLRLKVPQIRKLKSFYGFVDNEEALLDAPTAPSHAVDGSSLLFRQTQQVDMLEILTTMPPKPKVDDLISRFFDQENFPITVPRKLNYPVFRAEYKY